MKGTRCSSVVGLLCSISSCIICACGIFLDQWWQRVTTEPNKQHYGLFTAVRCKDYICHLHLENSSTEFNASRVDTGSSSPDWILFLQAFSLMQFAMLIFAIILQFISLLNGSIYILIVASGAIGWAFNVEQCTKSKLVISTYEATDNGLVYIQGQDERCKHETVSGLALYKFDFTDCNIEWEMLFRIVVQKNKNYQTGADKVIPIFSVADRSAISVTNSKTAEKEDDSSQNLTVKPSARMSFYKVVSEEEVSGKKVKLTDTLIMALQLDDQFTGDFDINARYCIASDIVIIENFCSTDTDLFPNFSRFKTGYLMSQFGAFRPTNLQGEALEMNFTCVLEVCKDACEEAFCGGGETGWGRKRREINSVISKENRDGVIFPEKQFMRQANYDIDVGGKVNIVERYSDIKVITEETVCLSSAVLITLLVFLSAGFVVTFASAIVFYRKWMTAQSQTKSVLMRSNCIRKMANSAVKGKY